MLVLRRHYIHDRRHHQASKSIRTATKLLPRILSGCLSRLLMQTLVLGLYVTMEVCWWWRLCCARELVFIGAATEEGRWGEAVGMHADAMKARRGGIETRGRRRVARWPGGAWQLHGASVCV